MPKAKTPPLSKADVALRQISKQRRVRFLDDIMARPTNVAQAVADLETLVSFLDQTVQEDELRDEAERILLRLITHERIAQLFYEIRRRCV